ncbi:MAG: methionyl-tRNA formyltransferase [Chthoniobacterales bacterium]
MRIVFIGTGEIGVPSLRALRQSEVHQLVGIVTQPDRPVGRSQRIQAPPIKQEIAEARLPILQPERLRNPEAVAELRALQPELIVVMAYGQILPKSVLEIPSVACLNLHASLLPAHRGAAPIQAAIVTGDTETGITVIYMDEGLDTGDILLQKKLTLSPDETGGSLHNRLAELAPEALLSALEKLENRSADRVPQDSSKASYASKLDRAAGRIDWRESAVNIDRKIRAYDPWPGAFTEISDGSGKVRQLKIFRATVVEESVGDPGTMDRPNESEVVVATGRGGLRLEQVQLEGKRRLTAVEFLRGFSSPKLHF